MRILSSLTYYSPHISGLTIYAQRILAGLSARGHTTTVVTSQFDDALPKKETLEGVRIVRTRAWVKVSKGILMPFYAFRIGRELHRHDVLLLHLPQLEASIAALYARLIARRRVVTVVHCDIELPPGLIRAIFTPVIRVSHQITGMLSNVLVVNSRDYARASRFLRRFASKVVVSAPPCVLPPRPPDARSPHPSGKPLIGFVGRFAEEKGIIYLLDALPAILDKAPEARLVFVGQWENVLGEKVFARVKSRLARLEDHVTLAGVISDEDLGACYRAFDVLVLPSINSTESFGMVQVEAMLAGTPVVASDIPGVREPVSATGMGELVPCRRPEAIAEAVLRITADRDRYVKPRETIERVFGLERAVRFHEDLLTAVQTDPASLPEALRATEREP